MCIMPLNDTKGVPWAHRDTCKAGDRLKCDGDFTCMAEGTVSTVQAEPKREAQFEPGEYEDFMSLFIPCADGKHFLDCQIGEDGELVGLYNA
jgi:hypothetical protein